MKTRRAKPGSLFRQERYMSAPELERGLLATCVASRCRILDDEEDRALLWFLQRFSHQPGGLQAMVEEIVQMWPERFRSPFMQTRGGNRPYRREELDLFVEDILGRPAPRSSSPRERALLEWGRSFAKDEAQTGIASLLGEVTDSVTIEALGGLCRSAALGEFPGQAGLADFLFKRVCLDPALSPGGWWEWYVPALRQTLLDYQAVWVDQASKRMALTEITKKVFEALDYALDVRGLVVIQGLERRGKTFSAKAWCDQHPGEARYVKTPSTSDDIGFFREIARSLGIGCGQSIKTVELRDRIEETLRGGDLMLVFDNAHYLFRQAMYREAIPQRLTWILTALVDECIPVAFISTPQFTVAQQLTSEKSKWCERQFTGRISHFEQLPEALSAEDLAACARVWLPGASDASVDLLVTYAEASDKYLQAIGSLAERATYLAGKQGREEPTFKDIKEALQTGVIPSDSAIVAATESAKDLVHRRSGRRPSTVKKVRAARMRDNGDMSPHALSIPGPPRDIAPA